MLVSIYLYFFSAVFFIVSMPYVVKPGIAIFENKTINGTVIKKLIYGMGFVALSSSYFHLARHGLNKDNLQFPLSLIRYVIPETNRSDGSTMIYIIMWGSIAFISVFLVFVSIFTKSRRKDIFRAAMASSVLFLFMYYLILGGDISEALKTSLQHEEASLQQTVTGTLQDKYLELDSRSKIRLTEAGAFDGKRSDATYYVVLNEVTLRMNFEEWEQLHMGQSVNLQYNKQGYAKVSDPKER